MKKIIITFVGSVLLIILLGLGYCSYKLRNDYFNWNQKITVTVQTPEGDVFGSSVQRVEVAKRVNKIVRGRAVSAKFKGEAVIVELPEGKKLFLLIRDLESILPRILSPKLGWGSIKALQKAGAQPLKTLLPIPPKHYPMLVTFSDVNNPASVKLVDPANLAATFGAGYALKSITLEITDEPVTTGKVESVLGWIYKVDRIVPKNQIKKYKSGEKIPGLLDFIDWKTFRATRADRSDK